MERIAPAPRDQLISFALQSMQCTSDASLAAADALRAVSDGEITPIEATSVMGLIDSYRRTLELKDIETRIAALETDLAHSA